MSAGRNQHQWSTIGDPVPPETPTAVIPESGDPNIVNGDPEVFIEDSKKFIK